MAIYNLTAVRTTTTVHYVTVEADGEEQAKEIFEATTAHCKKSQYIEDHCQSDSETTTIISQIDLVEDKAGEFERVHLGTKEFDQEVYSDLTMKLLDAESSVRATAREMGYDARGYDKYCR